LLTPQKSIFKTIPFCFVRNACGIRGDAFHFSLTRNSCRIVFEVSEELLSHELRCCTAMKLCCTWVEIREQTFLLSSTPPLSFCLSACLVFNWAHCVRPWSSLCCVLCGWVLEWII